ncbi:MAG: CehA/McbA family metallohydrolase [Eubacteriales bacterium]|nr:CehA/McbA family metallohydrolase [Eubacteriales bacterium]
MKRFDPTYAFYKGNLHTHTTCSDGRRTPDEAEALYRQNGYDFIAFTDHWSPQFGRQDKDFVVLGGVELDVTLPYGVCHVVGIGMEESFALPPKERTDAQGCVDAIRAAGGLAILAHPAWSLMEPADIRNLTGLSGAEVYNAVSVPPWNGQRADSSNLLDICAARGSALYWVAADDAHFYDGDACQAFVCVNAPALTQKDICAALAQGRFYASRGPQIHQLSLTDGIFSVECSPCQQAIFYSNTVWSHHRVTRRADTRYTYAIHPADTFIRVELSDAQGRQAWSSPWMLTDAPKQ